MNIIPGICILLCRNKWYIVSHKYPPPHPNASILNYIEIHDKMIKLTEISVVKFNALIKYQRRQVMVFYDVINFFSLMYDKNSFAFAQMLSCKNHHLC